MSQPDKILVCGFRSYFDDDLVSFCEECSRVVYFRPYQAVVDRRICLHCAIPHFREPGSGIEVPEQAVIECLHHFYGRGNLPG